MLIIVTRKVRWNFRARDSHPVGCVAGEGGGRLGGVLPYKSDGVLVVTFRGLNLWIGTA